MSLTFNGPIIYNRQLHSNYLHQIFFQSSLILKKLYIDHSKVAFLLSEKQVKHPKITVFSQQI